MSLLKEYCLLIRYISCSNIPQCKLICLFSPLSHVIIIYCEIIYCIALALEAYNVC